MKFKRSYSNARNLKSAYKFAFGGDINRAAPWKYAATRRPNLASSSSLLIRALENFDAPRKLSFNSSFASNYHSS